MNDKPICFEDILCVDYSNELNCYQIHFANKKSILVKKRRALIALLLLLKYEICSEADLVGANDRLKEIKSALSGKMNLEWIQDRYGDANKPFSELWTEEGFSCVQAEGMKGNRQYVLREENRALLFNAVFKTSRIQLSVQDKEKVLEKQNYRCNICGAKFKEPLPHTFARDRVKCEFDHRIPVDHGGTNSIKNIQALCHYCNKCKRQMCFVCKNTNCSNNCALVNPETFDIVIATGENITDRITARLTDD